MLFWSIYCCDFALFNSYLNSLHFCLFTDYQIFAQFTGRDDRKVLIHDGYRFYRHRATNTKGWRWRCAGYHHFKCSCRAITSLIGGYDMVKFNIAIHNHARPHWTKNKQWIWVPRTYIWATNKSILWIISNCFCCLYLFEFNSISIKIFNMHKMNQRM